LTKLRWFNPPREADPARVQPDAKAGVILESDSAAARRRKAAKKRAKAKVALKAATSSQKSGRHREELAKVPQSPLTDIRILTRVLAGRSLNAEDLGVLERRFAKALRREREVLSRIAKLTRRTEGDPPLSQSAMERLPALRSSQAQLQANREHHERAWRHAYARQHGRDAPREPN
jgi:hypothetical protein